jgi:hypothetical protein
MGIVNMTHASPGVLGRSITEGYLTQPNVMARLQRGPFAFTGTINFEGFTLDRGELNAGIYGEGYVDRRHPHTLVHEAMGSVASPATHRVRLSLAFGKGFTPFGTDDPMMRPLEKFPVNHHHAQVIERVQAIASVLVGTVNRGVSVEHAYFNGDEPTDPFSAPQWNRFGDSRAFRISAYPARGVEAQFSKAFIASPGIIQGGGTDHTQTSASLRINRTITRDPMTPTAGTTDHAIDHMSDAPHKTDNHRAMQQEDRRYLLLEVARTDEGLNRVRFFRYNSMLAEGMWGYRGWSVAMRGEQTERPENERLLNPFRVANGHVDVQLIGITRWTIATLNLAAPAQRIPLGQSSHVTPFVEVSRAVPQALQTPAVFEPAAFYGANRLWSFTVGLRLHTGTMVTRMGRYGVLFPTP